MARHVHILAALLSLAVAGCDTLSEIRIAAPSANARLVAPVPVTIELTAAYYTADSLSVVLQAPEGDSFTTIADVTSAFPAPTTRGSNLLGSSGTVSVPGPGRYRLLAGACWRGEIYFVQSPSFATSACESTRVEFTTVQPELQLSATALDLTAGVPAPITVALVPPPPANQPVTLASALTAPATATVPAGSTAPVAATLSPSTAGSTTLTATAPAPWGSRSIPLAVRPRLVSVSPTSAEPGATLTVTGQGFAAPLTVAFTGIAPIAATLVDGQTARFTLPMLAPGSRSFRLTSAGQPSTASVAIQVLAGGSGPFSTPFILYRSHATGIEVISYRPGTAGAPGTFALLPGGISAAASPGFMVVGLDRAGPRIVRSSATAIEEFTLTGTPTAPVLVRAGRSPATGTGSAALTGVGASVSTDPAGPYVRGTDRGLEVWTPGTNPLARAGRDQNAGLTSTGVAVLVDGQLALRSLASSLELWSLAGANPAVVPGGTNIQVFSAPVGTGLAWMTRGSYAIRSFASGIEIIEVTPTRTTQLGTNNRGAPVPFATVGLANSAGGQVAVRATANGLEVYALPAPTGADPTLCGVSREGDASAGGVAVQTSGPLVFRATSTSIEAYDLSTLSCPATNSTAALTLRPVIFRTGLADASTGLGLTWTINLP